MVVMVTVPFTVIGVMVMAIMFLKMFAMVVLIVVFGMVMNVITVVFFMTMVMPVPSINRRRTPQCKNNGYDTRYVTFHDHLLLFREHRINC